MSEFQPPDTPDPFDGMESGDVLDHKRDHFAQLLPAHRRKAFYGWLDDEHTWAYAEGRKDEAKESDSSQIHPQEAQK